MAKTSSVSVKIDSELKEQLRIIYAEYGMTLPQAVKFFLDESLIQQGIPFDLGFTVPGQEEEALRRCDFCGNHGAHMKLLKSPLGTCICEDCSLICKILF